MDKKQTSKQYVLVDDFSRELNDNLAIISFGIRNDNTLFPKIKQLANYNEVEKDINRLITSVAMLAKEKNIANALNKTEKGNRYYPAENKNGLFIPANYTLTDSIKSAINYLNSLSIIEKKESEQLNPRKRSNSGTIEKNIPSINEMGASVLNNPQYQAYNRGKKIEVNFPTAKEIGITEEYPQQPRKKSNSATQNNTTIQNINTMDKIEGYVAKLYHNLININDSALTIYTQPMIKGCQAFLKEYKTLHEMGGDSVSKKAYEEVLNNLIGKNGALRWPDNIPSNIKKVIKQQMFNDLGVTDLKEYREKLMQLIKQSHIDNLNSVKIQHKSTFK